MTQLTFGGNFCRGGKPSELNPFSTVSQDIIYSFGLGEMPGRVPSTTGRGGFSLKIVKGAKINKDK
jgi:hypothetical protein